MLDLNDAVRLKENYEYIVGNEYELEGRSYQVKKIDLFQIMSHNRTAYRVRVICESSDREHDTKYEQLENFVRKAGLEPPGRRH